MFYRVVRTIGLAFAQLGILFTALFTALIEPANAFGPPGYTTEGQAVRAIKTKLPPRPVPFAGRYWGGANGANVGPALTSSCERDIVAGLAFADDSFRQATERGLVTAAETTLWATMRAETAQVMTANLAQQQIWNACIYRRNKIGELNSLLPRITLSDATFAVCDGEVDVHQAAFAAQLAIARNGRHKDTAATRLNDLEASTTSTYTQYRAANPSGVNALPNCEAASLQIYMNAIRVIYNQFGLR